MDAMNQLYRNFKKDGADRKSDDYIKRRLDTLDLYWQEFQINHGQLCEFSDQPHEYFTKNQFEQTRSFYTSTRNYIALYGTGPTESKPSTPRFSTAGPAAAHTEPSTPLIPKQPEVARNPVMKPATFTFHNSETKTQGTSSKVEEMLRKQASNFRAMTRTINNIDLSHISEKWEFEDILRTLQSRWSAIDSLHWEIDSDLIGTNEEYENAFLQQEIAYNKIKRSINSKMWSVSHREQSTPRMEIPTFTGNYHQWVSFKDLFVETVHNNPSISRAQKMQFLKSKIKGDAEKLIQHLNISSDNYQVCWDILNNRFNNTKLIFTSHVNILMGIPTIQQQSSGHIKKIHDTTNECLNAIKNLGVNISTWDPLLVHLLSQKLDAQTYNDYIECLKNPRELPSLKEFLDFLENKFTSLESSRRKQEPVKSYHQPPTFINKPHFQKHPVASIGHRNSYVATIKCALCNNNHGLFYCKTFLEMQPEAKRKTVSKLNLCKNCLYDHNGNVCKSTKKCRLCNGNHNSILHDAFANASNNQGNSSNSEGPRANQSSNHVADKLSETLLATALVKIQKADGSFQTMRALIDQGSQTSLITENAAQQLGLPRKQCNGVISGIGTKQNSCKGVLTISCMANHCDYSFSTDVFIMKTLIKNLPNQSFKKPSWDYLKNIHLADPEFYVSRPIDLLLGAEVYSTIILGGIIREAENQPIAQQSQLGWIICGNVKTYQCNVILNNIEDMQRFWEIEDIAENSDLSQDDQECLQFYNSTTKRREDGRYEVRLPMKLNLVEKLGESKSKAVAQFRQLEKKLIKQENLSKDYKSFIQEYHQLGHMRESKFAEINDYYLPHHSVQRAESTTTSLRVVFNASAKTSTGYSLNDVMHRGPNLQKDLFSLILKWRGYQCALTADIEKMFRQILLNEVDQKYQKIIWRDSPQHILREYQLTTVTYGTKAAPFLAMMTLKRLARDESQNYQSSQAAKVLEESFYTDDLLSGTHDISSARKLQTDLINLLKSGGFNLRKWTSNKSELLEGVSRNQVKQDIFDFKQKESTKTLGLRWNPTEDKFIFQFSLNSSNSKTTKRTLLSDISKLFDPLGWLSPITTKLKLLFQRVWLLSLQWDDELPKEIIAEWHEIKADLTNIKDIEVPRWLESHKDDLIELHGFCDSSTKAYASVVYCKITKQGEPRTSIVLVAAKARIVSQNKNVTLPRLELCGAHLLSKLLIKVQTSLAHFKLKVFGWTDSTAVLGWINGDSGRWKPFVANRVNQIKNAMPPECWSYVKSEDNPADCASRGITAIKLKDHPLWWRGPTWLASYKEQINNEKPTFETTQELRNFKQTNATTLKCKDSIIDKLLTKYSSFTRLIHVLAWIQRAASRNRIILPYLTVNELRQVQVNIMKHVQQNEFLEDILHLRKHKKVENSSKLLNLKPFLDDHGLLRVGGRLSNANISYEMKHPLIIPHNSELTNLLIDYAHKLTFHGGARLTLSHIRQKYWLIKGNQTVKKRLYQCVKCRKHSPILNQQLMGDLPEARINPTRPFYHTGVDFTGYVDVKTNKGRGVKTTKGYIAVFVCMVTKAIHLELVSDLSASSFLAALRRFAARRGTPKRIWSDNGTNFVGASRKLKEEFIDLKQILSSEHEFSADISDMEIEWHFNAPSWPSAGGLWEAAVKSLKFHLKRVIGEQKLTYEEFSTLLAQLEACLNTRPLCALSEDPEDLNYLTPSHFLSSGPILSIIETERDERTRWQLTQKIFNDVWKRWRSEYLTQLSTRSKWKQSKQNIKMGDVVTIHDGNLPAGKWALGRVVELHPGKDGIVRVVSLKTKNGIIKRPIVKLSILCVQPEMKSNGENSNLSTTNDNAGTRRYRPTRNNKSIFTTLITTLLLFMTMFPTSHCLYNITALNQSQGIYFDNIGNVQLIKEEWKLIVYYNMQPYWEGNTALNKYLKHLNNICSVIKDPSNCNTIQWQLQYAVNDLEYYDNMLLGQHFDVHARHRRGLINGIGSIARSLFGVLDEDFAKQYEQDINTVRDNQKHLAILWQNQTSVVEAEYNLLKRTEDSMYKQHKIINQRLYNLNQASIVLKEEVEQIEIINDFTLSSIIANNLMSNLRSIQNVLLDTITNIYHGKLSTHLLTPSQLRDELSIISGQLPKDLSLPIENTQTDLRKMYNLLKVRTRMTNQYLMFEIRVPLVSRDSYDVYSTIPVPQQEGALMSSLTPIAQNIAINLQKDAYLPMNENEIRDCIQYDSHNYLCNLQRPIYHMKSEKDLCIKDQTNNECKVNSITCKDSWTGLRDMNTYLFFCCNQCTLKIICQNQLTIEQVSKAGIITLGNDCLIKSDQFTIYSHKLHMSEVELKSNVLVPKIAPINHILNISVPLSIIPLAYNISEHQKYLKDIGDQIKQMKAEKVLTDRISYHDVHHYVLIYIVVGVAIIVTTVYVCRRVRRCRCFCLERAPSAQPADGGDSASASSSACVCVSESANHSACKPKQNKATSPMFQKTFVIRE